MHPTGWTDRDHKAFHGGYLHEDLSRLGECRQCHGDDFGGGAVGVGCSGKGCHNEPGGPEACNNCHGTAAGPMPESGAHKKHEAFCVLCHTIPDKLVFPDHVNGTADLTFGGIALGKGSNPVWDAAGKTCADVYCHNGTTATWQKPAADKTPCDFCHQTPPTSHARFASVATSTSCATCHPVPPSSTHIDAKPQVNEAACNTCHGHGPLGVPGPTLEGSMDPATSAVGAHDRHLNDAITDRIGATVACSACHVIPTSVFDPGHLDSSAPADVKIAGGTYDPANRSCNVDCHWNKTPGPSWNDVSGAERACGACHAFPPLVMRDGTTHTYSPPVLSACQACHPFSPTTHVNGLVELGQ